MTYRRAAPLLLAALVAACQNLDVANPNAPTLAASLDNPANVELTAGSSVKYLWAQMQNDDPRQGVTLFPRNGTRPGLADEITFGTNANQFNDVAGRPRVTFDNAFAGSWTTRMPMANYYTAVSGCADVIRAINLDGMRLGTCFARISRRLAHSAREVDLQIRGGRWATSTSASSTTRASSSTTTCDSRIRTSTAPITRVPTR
jgi:hypothetical protein